MHLYRYFGSHALETLRDNRLMLAMPSTLNDPFEFLYRSTGEMTLAKARAFFKRSKKSDNFCAELRKKYPAIKNKKDCKRHIEENLESMAQEYLKSYSSVTKVKPQFCYDLGDKTFRIACFSSPDVEAHEEILMWSHYASKHSGVRIKFDVNENSKWPYWVKKVNYEKERVGLDFTNGADDDSVKKGLIQAISTKAAGWKYEREYRMFWLPSDCRDETDENSVTRSFIKFDPKLVVGIDFGIKCPDKTIKEVMVVVNEKYKGIEVRRAVHHQSSFAIDYVSMN